MIKFEECIFNQRLHLNIEGSNATTCIFDHCSFTSLYKLNFTINGDGYENFYISNCVFKEITDGFLTFDSEIRNRLVIESSSFLRISTPKCLSPLLEGPQKFLEYCIFPTRVLESSRPLEQMTRPLLSLLFHR